MVLINLRSLSAQGETEKYLFYFILTNKISCCKNIMIIYCVQRLKLAVGLRQICIYDNRAWGPPPKTKRELKFLKQSSIDLSAPLCDPPPV